MFTYNRRSDIRKGGAEEEIGERITLRVIPLNELLTATQDAKTFCAFALYNSLK
ncbi:hypothetical protein V1506DRAFT_549329 [Lipomyces tetrasporus]